MCEDLRLKHPFISIISRPSWSGKSSFCIKLLQNLKSFSTETKFDGGILWRYGESNVVLSVDVGMTIQFPEGVTDKFDNAGYKPCLIILDDQLNEAYYVGFANYLQKEVITETLA